MVKNKTTSLFICLWCKRTFNLNEFSISLFKLYHERTGSYWGSGRELVDREYSDIVIPFKDFIR